MLVAACRPAEAQAGEPGPPAPLAVEGVTSEQLELIKAALPEKARMKPEKPRRLLAFTLARGFVHASIPHGALAIRLMGEKTGAYETIISNDAALFEPGRIEQFDAICLISTTGDPFLPADFDQLTTPARQAAIDYGDALRGSFLKHIESGRGLIGIHAATDSFYGWHDFGHMIGGYFDGHPWHESVGIRRVDPHHPLVAGLGGDFTIVDEIYQFKDPYSRHSLRELLALDPARTDMNKPGINRRDGDFAVSWIRRQGMGRVFYSSLGHREEIFWNRRVLAFYLDGIQFALGDFPADATPSDSIAMQLR